MFGDRHRFKQKSVHTKLKTFASKAINYFAHLQVPSSLPSGIEVLNPYKFHDVNSAVEKFFNTFYNDNQKRIFILGINPGRFGGGLTGISFTDPVALRRHCGIDNQLGNKEELSSKFIYKIIKLFGGVNKFFSKFFLSALFPLALIRNGKNYNYYDDKNLFLSLKPHLVNSLISQFKFGAENDIVICLGKKNSEFLTELNKELCLFNEVITLEHPRYIMQYRKKNLNFYLKRYTDTFDNTLKTLNFHYVYGNSENKSTN